MVLSESAHMTTYDRDGFRPGGPLTTVLDALATGTLKIGQSRKGCGANSFFSIKTFRHQKFTQTLMILSFRTFP